MEIKDIISSGLLEMYALGTASADENAQVEEWVREHWEVAQELAVIEKSLEDMAFANAVRPADNVKSGIFNKLNFSNTVQAPASPAPQPAKVYRVSPIWQRVAAAAILLLAGSVIFNFVYYNKYKKADLAYEQKSEELIAQSEQLKTLDDDMSIVRDKYSLPVSLKGLEAAPEAAAKIFWMKNTGEVYIDPGNLPEAPAGKQYQLWAIVDGKPVDAGMIVTSKKGNKYSIQKMKTFGKADAFAVTLETEGGNPSPKGTMFVMGEL